MRRRLPPHESRVTVDGLDLSLRAPAACAIPDRFWSKVRKHRYAIEIGDAVQVLSEFRDECLNCCVTSPPYWGQRDYGVEGQLGLEQTPDEFVAAMVKVFREVRRVLTNDGTCWINLGDSYAMTTKGAGGAGKQHTNAGSVMRDRSWSIPPGLKSKDLVGIPWRVAFALQADGWYLRSDIIWAKPNPMPEPVKDRPTKSHEYLFLLTKSERYAYDIDAIKEPRVDGQGNRNARSVWTITPKPVKEAHFATFPEELPERCILAGCPSDGIVLDPFTGSGTTGRVATRLGRKFLGIELNPEYAALAEARIKAA